jgi:hypothetical protein
MEFSSKKGIRTFVRMGQVYDYWPFASVLWPEHGPFILLERVGKTTTWIALDVGSNGLETIVPCDDSIYKRIA